MLLILLEEFLCRVIFYLNYIVNVLFKTGMIESFGSGFNRTFLACKKTRLSVVMKIQNLVLDSYSTDLMDIKMSKTCLRHVQDISKTCPRLKS